MGLHGTVLVTVRLPPTLHLPPTKQLPRRALGLGLALTLLFAAGACSNDTPATGDFEGTVLVSAAASLTDAFADVAVAFETAHPAIDVMLNFAASSALRDQIIEGAPIDVFASANPANMTALVGAGLVEGDPRVFVRNLLQIAVPAGNPAGITGLADFARGDLFIGLCAAGVPCGDFARTALANAGVTPAIDSNEPDVRALLTKIEAGELDAGITYVTDVASAGGTVEGIDIPEAVNVVAEYPIAVIATAPNPEAAAAFVSFVLSADGQAILAGYGFTSP
jgi:molybdate transport system substrate-binding protein